MFYFSIRLNFSRKVTGLLLLGVFLSPLASAQPSNNSSSLTNSAAPAASSVTTGGTNINYQSNNTYQNEFGFAPGIFCRTPTVFIGGSYGEASLDAYDPVQKSGNNNANFNVNAGIAIPFGSPIIDYCKQLAGATARDREISSQLSMLRTCAQLEKDNLSVDADIFPMLKPCTLGSFNTSQPKPNQAGKSLANSQERPSNSNTLPALKPRTTREL
ncbi:hypothetical protein KBY58_02265 [Cyanobium sp. HWJ4-Hawea]|uniref:hypothetical protein n=1 Tax=Cyanobium sp. HWJ4-Hawea TaxID=2823713 RepID=UPI0020CE002E|nr:hypothetical protein [Cyanobium sp. HWJ4-Hawea]MCP9808257.1 hypothetical protein [Cyanobium sp. HWJ4-Hawea]